jgi:uncharacterized membrane protein
MKHFHNRAITNAARADLAGKWDFFVKLTLLYLAVTILISLFPGGDMALLVIDGPIMLGVALVYLRFIRKEKYEYDDLFDGFKQFGSACITYLVMVVFILLWAVLLIVPGVIAALAYSQTFFLLADNPSLRPLEALKKSKEMMMGYKWQYFRFLCRFIPWLVLAVIPLGIGLLWFIPYMLTSQAHFYEKLKNNEKQAHNPAE